jgi:hypothetical protein
MVCEANQIAREFACFIRERSIPGGLVWFLYRVNPIPGARPIYLGRGHSPAGIRKLVEKVCPIKTTGGS